ncbi:hypothetical protein FGA82_14760 [Pseudomonas fluorescens]|nr:hypothetical protein FGA82_14760 [Pseudomonas fluorescens]
MWERACSRKRSISRHKYRLMHRHRWQASSHRFLCRAGMMGITPINVGVSLLAMSVVQTMEMVTGPASSRAGSLLQGFV